jgi:transposase
VLSLVCGPKRFRKWLKPLQNKQEYEQKRKRLHTLLFLAKQDMIKLYFGDESGFSLTPCVPYGWIKQGENACMLSQRSPRINVFGLLGTDNHLLCYQKSGSLNADFISQCLDAFCLSISQPTVIVLDNASWHTCQVLEAKRGEWEKKGLYIFFLPKYSPHLNRIERLWKQVKYHWLKAEDYLSLEALRQALHTIFIGFGTYFTLDFKELEVDQKLILNFE